MRRLALAASLIGLFILMLIFESSSEYVSSIRDLERFEIGQKVYLQGIVEEERNFGETKLISINEIDIVCECDEDYLGKSLVVEGIIEDYLGKRQIKVLRIRNLD